LARLTAYAPFLGSISVVRVSVVLVVVFVRRRVVMRAGLAERLASDLSLLDTSVCTKNLGNSPRIQMVGRIERGEV